MPTPLHQLERVIIRPSSLSRSQRIVHRRIIFPEQGPHRHRSPPPLRIPHRRRHLPSQERPIRIPPTPRHHRIPEAFREDLDGLPIKPVLPLRSRPDQPLEKPSPLLKRHPHTRHQRLISQNPPSMPSNDSRRRPRMRNVPNDVPPEPLRLPENHPKPNPPTPVMPNKQDIFLQPQSVHQSQQITRHVFLRPPMRRSPRPPIPRQIRRNNPHPLRRIPQQIPIRVVMLRPPMQRKHRRPLPRLTHMESDSSRLDKASTNTRDCRWVLSSSHISR